MQITGLFDNQLICTLLASYCEKPEKVDEPGGVVACITTINKIFATNGKWNWEKFLINNCMEEVKVLAEQIEDPELEGQCRAWFDKFHSMGDSDQLTIDECLKVRHRVIDRICARYLHCLPPVDEAKLPLLGMPLRRMRNTCYDLYYPSSPHEPPCTFLLTTLSAEGRIAEARAFADPILARALIPEYVAYQAIFDKKNVHANLDEIVDFIHELPPEEFIERADRYCMLYPPDSKRERLPILDIFRERAIVSALALPDAYKKSEAILDIIRKCFCTDTYTYFDAESIHDLAIPKFVHLASTECIPDHRVEALKLISLFYKEKVEASKVRSSDIERFLLPLGLAEEDYVFSNKPN